MNNKIIKTLDSQTRLKIPNAILELIGMENVSEFWILPNEEEENSIKLVEAGIEVDSILLGKCKADAKSRIFLPREIRGETKDFCIFLKIEGGVIRREIFLVGV